jgi:hypothetical protein
MFLHGSLGWENGCSVLPTDKMSSVHLATKKPNSCWCEIIITFRNCWALMIIKLEHSYQDLGVQWLHFCICSNTEAASSFM